MQSSWNVTDGEKIYMPEGKYFIGNLHGVLNEETRDELSNLHFQNGSPVEGRFKLSDGRDVVSYLFAVNESAIQDYQGREYRFKGTGLVSITKTGGLEEEFGDWDGGHIVEFKNEFICQSSTCSNPTSYPNKRSVRICFGEEVCLNGEVCTDEAEEDFYAGK
jgi:hypothetical protein